MKFYIKKYTYINEQNADIAFLPPMTRRKLSLLDKIALCAMQNCFEYSDVKLVFASQYGETDRLRKLVNQYTQENEVSPAAFSASVHNNPVGQFSLLNKINQSYNSLSADKNTFCAGLIESIISSNETDVLYCFCDTEKECIGFSCLITVKKNEGRCLKLKQLNIAKNVESKDSELNRFLLFLDNKIQYFYSNDGQFEITKTGEK